MCILFSRIIPLEQAPQEHRLWQLAELFGATCLADTDPSITHVITNTLGTQKVRLCAPLPGPLPGRRVVCVHVCLCPHAAVSHRVPCACAIGALGADEWQGRGDPCMVRFFLPPPSPSWHPPTSAQRPLFLLVSLECVRVCFGGSRITADVTVLVVHRLECSCTLWERAAESRFPVL